MNLHSSFSGGHKYIANIASGQCTLGHDHWRIVLQGEHQPYYELIKYTNNPFLLIQMQGWCSPCKTILQRSCPRVHCPDVILAIYLYPPQKLESRFNHLIFKKNVTLQQSLEHSVIVDWLSQFFFYSLHTRLWQSLKQRLFCWSKQTNIKKIQ